jgi:hypothetical protein
MYPWWKQVQSPLRSMLRACGFMNKNKVSQRYNNIKKTFVLHFNNAVLTEANLHKMEGKKVSKCLCVRCRTVEDNRNMWMSRPVCRSQSFNHAENPQEKMICRNIDSKNLHAKSKEEGRLS